MDDKAGFNTLKAVGVGSISPKSFRPPADSTTSFYSYWRGRRPWPIRWLNSSNPGNLTPIPPPKLKIHPLLWGYDHNRPPRRRRWGTPGRRPATPGGKTERREIERLEEVFHRREDRRRGAYVWRRRSRTSLWWTTTDPRPLPSCAARSQLSTSK